MLLRSYPGQINDNLVYREVPDNYFAFWRNYKNNLISHFCRWEDPWKNSDYNQKMNDIC